MWTRGIAIRAANLAFSPASDSLRRLQNPTDKDQALTCTGVLQQRPPIADIPALAYCSGVDRGETFRLLLIEYLGQALKSDEVLELIRSYDLPVIYEVDTLQENIPDGYSAKTTQAGFSLGFDDNQILVTIFCHLCPRHDFEAIDPSLIGVPIYKTLAEARQGAVALGASCEVKEGIAAFGRVISFAKLSLADHSRHYEFTASGLELITLMRSRTLSD